MPPRFAYGHIGSLRVTQLLVVATPLCRRKTLRLLTGLFTATERRRYDFRCSSSRTVRDSANEASAE